MLNIIPACVQMYVHVCINSGAQITRMSTQHLEVVSYKSPKISWERPCAGNSNCVMEIVAGGSRRERATSDCATGGCLYLARISRLVFG